jgi:hypothetical protein
MRVTPAGTDIPAKLGSLKDVAGKTSKFWPASGPAGTSALIVFGYVYG